MKDHEYVYADARVKYRESTLLSDSDVEQMLSMKSADEVLDFLVSRGWGDGSANHDAEAVLSAEEEKTLSLMRELKLDPEFLEVLSYPQMFHNLKAGIKEIVTSEPHPKAFYPLKSCGRDEILKVLREKNYEALPAVLSQTAPKAFDLMLKTREGQAVDMMVDRDCLMAMEKAGRASKSPLFRDYLLTRVAVTDLKIAARCQKMGKNEEFIQNALAPCSLLDVAGLAKAASGKPDDLYAYMTKAGFGEEAKALAESFSVFERYCDDRLMDKLKTQHEEFESSGPVLAYYLARQAEIANARVILTGKANGFSKEAIRERVRKMYV